MPTDTATPSAPPRVLYMQCRENAVENDYDGGLVLFTGIRAGVGDDFIDTRLVLSARHDALMRDYPATREGMQGRFFRVTVEEVSAAELPPDPNAPPIISAAALLEQARDAAAREGNDALVQAIEAELAAP